MGYRPRSQIPRRCCLQDFSEEEEEEARRQQQAAAAAAAARGYAYEPAEPHAEGRKAGLGCPRGQPPRHVIPRSSDVM